MYHCCVWATDLVNVLCRLAPQTAAFVTMNWMHPVALSRCIGQSKQAKGLTAVWWACQSGQAAEQDMHSDRLPNISWSESCRFWKQASHTNAMNLGTSVKQAYRLANWSSLFACCSVSACMSAADPSSTSVPTVCIGDSVAVILSSASAFCRQMRGPLHTLPSKQLGNAFPWQQCKSACFQVPAG